MTGRKRDKIFEQVELKQRTPTTTTSGHPGANEPTGTAADATEHSNKQQYQNLLRDTSTRDGQYEDLNRKCTVPAEATIYCAYEKSRQQNLKADDTLKEPCSKTIIWKVVLVGIIAVLTALTVTGLCLAVMNNFELNKTEVELTALTQTMISMKRDMKELSSQVSKQLNNIMDNIAVLNYSTNNNTEAIQSQDIIIETVNATTSENVKALQMQRDTINIVSSELTRIRNNVTSVQRIATNNTNRIHVLVGLRLVTNCFTRMLRRTETLSGVSSNVSATTTPTLSLTVSSV